MAMPSILSNAADVRRRRQDEESRGLAVAAEHLRRQRLLQQQQQTVAAKPACQLTITPMVPLLLPRTSVAHTNGKVVIMAAEQGRSLLVREPPPRGLWATTAMTQIPTGAPGTDGVLNAVRYDWGVRSGTTVLGWTKPKLLMVVNAVALGMHLVFLLACIIVGASTEDPNLEVLRVRLGFSLPGNTTCRLTNASDVADVPFAVLEGNKMPINVVVMTCSFFLISACNHGLWTLGLSGRAPRLGAWLLDLLDRQVNPIKWIEYSFSAPAQYTVLLLASGQRVDVSIAFSWMLLWSTMTYGYLCEKLSTALPDGSGWEGDAEHGRFRNYVMRMIPHILGWFPYSACWFAFGWFFGQTLDDAETRFGEVGDAVPAWLYSAISTLFLTCVCKSGPPSTRPGLMLASAPPARRFSSFAVTQMVVQWRAPTSWWISEVIYGALSIGSKGLLGCLLLANLLATSARSSSV